MRCASHVAIIAAAVALAGFGAAARASVVIYSTGFEPPGYTSGVLTGQDGWQAFGAGNPTVESFNVKSGTQAGDVPGGFDGQHGMFHENPSGAQYIDVNADIQIASSTSEGDWQFATTGTGLAPFIAGIDIDANGTVHEITQGFAAIGTLSRDAWHNVDLQMNFGADTYALSIDNVLIGSNIPFCGDNGPCTTTPSGGYGDVLFDTFGGSTLNDSGYIDNLVVQTFSPGVPEPGEWALLLAGLAILGAGLRTRRREQLV